MNTGITHKVDLSNKAVLKLCLRVIITISRIRLAYVLRIVILDEKGRPVPDSPMLLIFEDQTQVRQESL
jgi:hypothetical protein